MNRRDTLRVLLAALVGSEPLLRRPGRALAQVAPFRSRWQDWPDVPWAGPDYWGNRLQDWRIQDGRLVCDIRASNRTLHCLTRRAAGGDFLTEVVLDPAPLREVAAGDLAVAGFRAGIRGRFDDFRSAAVHGEGWDAGIRSDGHLVLGSARSSARVSLSAPLRLRLEVRSDDGGALAILTAAAPQGGPDLAAVEAPVPEEGGHRGNIALLSHFPEALEGPGPAFRDWLISGAGVTAHPEGAYGPIMFAQYTLHRGTLKLTAQLAPVETIQGVRVDLERREAAGVWRPVASAPVDALSRTARFRVDGWDGSTSVDYRVRVRLPLRGGPAEYPYHGTVAAEPAVEDPVKAAVFSCNADHGFPDTEVVRNVTAHRPDLALFLGDQFYEGNGGFGIDTRTPDLAALDMLHKWYMFGWSYRELFRHIPAAFIPDDHDVYHGNIWGEGGKRAPTDQGWGAVAQDQGGYKMPAEWVNAVQRSQTSHLPDPFDPTPADQGIGVYYCRWEYGGVSFAVLEDRKFKSAPGNVLPAEAQVVNGWIQNPDFDIREYRDLAGATLLGARQMRFLDQWSRDWSGGSRMKVVLSQTNFAAVHTIPEDARSGAVIPGLPLPGPGEYVTGDKPAVDMDSNGWPQERRDAVLRVLRRCAAFHIAGDQHLATVVQHGIEAHDDGAFSFTGPALNNIWPRRWWPPAEMRMAPPDGGPPYTGRFVDGFGNRITVHAAANPRETGLEPAIIRNRATGYGVVTFLPGSGRIRMECWPRHEDPSSPGAAQYEGWPVEVDARAGDGRTPSDTLPPVRVIGLDAPVLEVLDAAGDVVYTRRMAGAEFTVPLFGSGTWTVRVGDPDRGVWQERVVTEDARRERLPPFDFR